MKKRGNEKNIENTISLSFHLSFVALSIKIHRNQMSIAVGRRWIKFLSFKPFASSSPFHTKQLNVQVVNKVNLLVKQIY